MCSSQAFKELCEDCEVMLKGVTELEQINSAEQLWFVRGQVNILKYILTLEQSTEIQYQQLKEQGEHDNVV